jgi:hypothetical protein
MHFSHARRANIPFERIPGRMHPAHVKRKEPDMRIELGSVISERSALRLGPNQTLRVVNGAGSTVCAVEGSVWITEENQPTDIVLEGGASYRLREKGLALINALGGNAAVTFA